MKWLFNSFMLWGAVLGWLITSSATNLLDTARHEDSGIVHYDGSSERVSEGQYKRYNYATSGLMLALGFYLWVTVARTARNEPAKQNRVPEGLGKN
jgi:hypothetical protein